ncbi:methyl-accepting chemotaxis protein [Exiguobacterium acetylicum]
MTGIAATAQQQSGAFDGHTASLQSLTATIEQTAQTSALVVDSASRSESLATTGRSDLHAVTEQMQSIQNAIDEAADKSRRVQTASQNVLEIISIIESIANETNLLSLNASIEAARAGEQGKGFVVVAREIQNLANQSKQSMVRVQETIDSIQLETKQLEDAMARGTVAVQDGVVRVTEATQSFDSIVTQSKGVTIDMSALSETNRDVLSTASHLVAQAEQLRAGIIASAQDNQQASDQSLTFSERMDVVHTLTEEIYTLSRELHETINRYTLD